MEQLYYILDTENNIIIIDNLTYEQAMEWFNLNGLICCNVIKEH